MAETPKNPTITLRLRASDVDNVIAFMNRAELKGTESEIHASLKQSIAHQANAQLEAIEKGAKANGRGKAGTETGDDAGEETGSDLDTGSHSAAD